MKLLSSLVFAIAAFVPAVVATGNKNDDREYTLKVTNLSFQQPFGPFFVMVHRSETMPLFTLGEPSSDALGILAENGSPADLIDMYDGAEGVYSVMAFTEGIPAFGGDTIKIDVKIPRRHRVTIASMAINTNDCFVALNNVKVQRGAVYSVPGYDSGTEENNENCNSIPGPACAEIDTDNQADGNGEGFVHVHRGFFGVGEDGLTAKGYDWRNPMMRVEVD